MGLPVLNYGPWSMWLERKTGYYSQEFIPSPLLTKGRKRLPCKTKTSETMGRSKNLFLVFVAILLTAVLLRRFLGAYAIIVPLLYMFFDVNWSLRVTWIVLKKLISGRKANHDFLEVSETSFIVLPSDMDLNLHMNNAR